MLSGKHFVKKKPVVLIINLKALRLAASCVDHLEKETQSLGDHLLYTLTSLVRLSLAHLEDLQHVLHSTLAAASLSTAFP